MIDTEEEKTVEGHDDDAKKSPDDQVDVKRSIKARRIM